jgi:hypothetical protein
MSKRLRVPPILAAAIKQRDEALAERDKAQADHLAAESDLREMRKEYEVARDSYRQLKTERDELRKWADDTMKRIETYNASLFPCRLAYVPVNVWIQSSMYAGGGYWQQTWQPVYVPVPKV